MPEADGARGGAGVPESGFLGALSAEARERLAAVWKTARMEAGGVIIGEGDAGDALFLLLSGRARSALFTRNGREVAFSEIGAGDCFGEVAALDGGVRTASVVALTPVTLGVVPGADLRALLISHPEIGLALLRLLCGKLREASSRLAGLAELSAPQRVRVELLRLARERRTGLDSARLVDPPTQAELAARVFARREAVAREMARLARRGLLQRGPDGLTVPSLRRLEAEIVADG
jgi:CRP-like cAMP-binding protein